MDEIEALLGVDPHDTADLWADDVALRELMDDILRYFVRRLPTRELAADCLSDVMLVLWRRKTAVPHDRDQLRAFAFGIARRTLLSTNRELAKSAARRSASDSEAPIPSHDEAADLRLDVQQALAGLKPADRELLLLTIWEQLTIADAAVVLGISAAGARQRHSRALRRLATVFPATTREP